jgi:hypothetical protein
MVIIPRLIMIASIIVYSIISSTVFAAVLVPKLEVIWHLDYSQPCQMGAQYCIGDHSPHYVECVGREWVEKECPPPLICNQDTWDTIQCIEES